MSCPDWQALVTAREALRDDPPGWRGGLEHLAHCDACRRQALAADPTLLFQRLPRPQADGAEIEAMRSAVATLVRSRRLEAPVSAPPARRPGRERWLRPAAAALLAGALTLGPAGPVPERAEPPVRLAAGIGAALPAGSDGERITAPPAAAFPTTPTAALVEDLDLPQARVYQLAQEDLSVVMIVDASLDL